MKCNYCEKEKSRLYHNFEYGFICWGCLCNRKGKKLCSNCGKEIKVFRKDLCLKCYRHKYGKSLNYGNGTPIKIIKINRDKIDNIILTKADLEVLYREDKLREVLK